ncbi:hypothetical protein [Proteus mirabilis]|uniref:hypothetical protein n=1 Tax=Proteus mirabilis TaxID=584 RepID=UPI0034D78230
MADITEVTDSALNALTGGAGYSSVMRGFGNGNFGGKATAQGLDENPYAGMYRDNTGYIFGKPLAYSPKTDPNHRVFQHTILRNNTLINIVPGKPYVNTDMLATAEKILTDHEEALEKLLVMPSSSKKEKAIVRQCQETQDKLISNKCDLRYYAFQQDVAGFMQAFQMAVNRVGTAVFGWSSSTGSNFVTDLESDLLGLNMKEDLLARGFKVWVDKGSSISETIDNSFTQSVLAQTQKSMSSVARQVRFLSGAMNMAGIQSGAEVQSADEGLSSIGKANNIASRSLSGSNFQFPDVFDDSKFVRSYEIAFRFVSPHGDDRSVFHHVLLPFLFLFTCASPKQDGVSGYNSPFLLQLDAPGFFSCPMGVVTSFSFRKGGDEMLFNNRGLPLIIEGSMSVQDLYSNLSLPLTYSQFATNMGTTAFFNTLGGLNLYATMDPSLRQVFASSVKDGITKVFQPYNIVSEEVLKIRRFMGFTS